MTADRAPQGPGRAGAFWTLRVLETALLLTALVGIGLFAWSLVDIVRIQTSTTIGIQTGVEPASDEVPDEAKHLPASAWPGVFLFIGSLALLQPVRAILVRYRRDDGSMRGSARDAGGSDARSEAARVTAEALAGLTDDPGPAGEAGPAKREG